jgi:hypothetical protein
MAEYAYISSRDGQPKKWMFDSQWYELPDGERRLVPMGVAEAARVHFSNTGSSGVREEPTVLIEPCEGEVEVAPIAKQDIRDPETGEEYGSVAELVAAVKARLSRRRAPKPAEAE